MDLTLYPEDFCPSSKVNSEMSLYFTLWLQMETRLDPKRGCSHLQRPLGRRHWAFPVPEPGCFPLSFSEESRAFPSSMFEEVTPGIPQGASWVAPPLPGPGQRLSI